MSNGNKSEAPRPYRKRKRAAEELRTRERITRATVALHETIGPADTSVRAIAQRAGVQRATVYRHFPDEQSLFDACTAHYFTRHPMPAPEAWAAITSPDARLARALAELYAWYGDTEQMVFNSLRDMEKVPPATRESFLGYFDVVHATLMKGCTERGRVRARVSAALGHAVSFHTWRSLVREQGLRDEEAISLTVAMVRAAKAIGARGGPPQRGEKRLRP